MVFLFVFWLEWMPASFAMDVTMIVTRVGAVSMVSNFIAFCRQLASELAPFATETI